MKWTIFFFFLLINPLIWAQNRLAIVKPSLQDLKIESPLQSSDYASFSFQTVRKMIYVEAKLDGKSGYCIIDTGSPSVLVNRKAEANETALKAMTVAQDLEIHHTLIKTLDLGGFKQENISGLAMPFRDFASRGGKRVLGLVGYSLLKNYEVLFDFDRQRIHLFPTKNAALHRAVSPRLQVNLELEGHLPVIEVKMGEKILRFGLDTGAATNIIDQCYADQFAPDMLHWLDSEQLQCLDGKNQIVEAAIINQISLDEQPIGSMKFLFVDMCGVNQQTEKKLDGLLGYEFFSQIFCSLNYHSQTLNIWKFLEPFE